jgi:GDP-4-dehydro-6-deoxy-D-mannose reductase
MYMSKVLITGVNGFVGQHLREELTSQGIEVVGIGGPQADSQKAQQNTLSLDLSDPTEANKIDFTGVTGVIHLAGLAAVGPSFDEPMRYIDTNIGIETNLFEAALKQSVTPRFLIISTGALYSPAAEMPITEISPILPSSPYAVSKIGQEEMAKYYLGRGFEVLIARPFNHIGPGQGPGFIVPDIAQQIVACEKGEQTNICVGNLDAKRDYTDVRDIVRAYRLLLENGVSGETYNVCSNNPMSGHDILSGLLNASGKSFEIKQDPAKMRPADNPVIYGNHDKLTSATGWEPEIKLDQTFTDVVADWRSREL